MPAPSFTSQKAGSSPPDLTDRGIALIGVTRAFGRDQAIFAAGDGAELVFKVVSGAVRSFRLLADGRRQIMAFHYPGELFGFELDGRRRVGAEAANETVVIAARRGGLASSPGQDDRLLRHAMGELQRAQDHLLTLGRRTAIERVAWFLADLDRRRDAGGEVVLSMSRQDIGDYLGLTLETVSRCLGQLQAQGAIRLSGSRKVALPRAIALAARCD